MNYTNMIIDNFELIANNLLTFNNSNEFYFVQIIQRRKDNNEVNVSSGYRRIKSFYIYSIAELQKLRNRIVELCESNNARAYISIVPKNAEEVALECIKRYTELVLNNNAFMGNHIWDSVCGSSKAKGADNLYVIDIDYTDPSYVDSIIHVLETVRGNPQIKLRVPTANGCHLITTGFDQNMFQEKIALHGHISHVDVQKNNLTLLYYNKRQT